MATKNTTLRLATSNGKRKAGGACIMQCGDEIKYPTHGLCARCYGSIRVWSANKTDEERAARLVNLSIYQARLNALDDGLVQIQHIGATARGKTHSTSAKSSVRHRLRNDRASARLTRTN